MLFAHAVPGYLIAIASEPHWGTEWTPVQRRVLWATALASTVLPDADVVYNAVFRGFMNHSILYTHSIFPYGLLAIISIGLYAAQKGKFLQILLMLIALGGLSHLTLDVIAHNTPLFYPLSNTMIGNAPAQITNGGIFDYVRHPLFLLEPVLIMLGIYFWRHHHVSARTK